MPTDCSDVRRLRPLPQTEDSMVLLRGVIRRSHDGSSFTRCTCGIHMPASMSHVEAVHKRAPSNGAIMRVVLHTALGITVRDGAIPCPKL